MEIVKALGLFFFLFFVIISCMLTIKGNAAKSENKDDEENDGITEINNPEEMFFEKARAGMKSFRIASLYSYYDVMFIKSFLESAAIPCFFEFENMNKLYGGIPMYGNVNVFLNILEEDYEEVVSLLETFEIQKKAMYQKEPGMATLLLGISLGWFMPISHLRTMKIYYQDSRGQNILDYLLARLKKKV